MKGEDGMSNFENLTIEEQESVNGGTWFWAVPAGIGGFFIFLDGVYNAGRTLGKKIYEAIND